MLRSITSYILFLTLATVAINAQTIRTVGLHENTPAVFALVNADVVTEPGSISRNTNIIVRDGIIVEIGRRADIPADAMIIDLDGKMVYPGFIDLYTNYGQNGTEAEGQHYWNPHIRSQYSSSANFIPDEEKASNMRSQGFVVVQSLPPHGLISGKGSIVSLGSGERSGLIIEPDITRHISFNISREIDSNYPTSAMGAISLIRQSLIDAEWYNTAHGAYYSNPSQERPEQNMVLKDLAEAVEQERVFIAQTSDEYFLFRAADIAAEFGLNIWIKGSGYEYRRLEAIRDLNIPLIVPVDFPDAPDVSSPEKSASLSLEELRNWYLAPENPSRVTEAGVTTALTAAGSGKDFLRNLRRAVERGLNKDDALAALTTTPAVLAGIDRKYGSISAGKSASFIIADGDIFEKNTDITQVWIDGKKYKTTPPGDDARGEWIISSGSELDGVVFEVTGQNQRMNARIKLNDESVNSRSFSFTGRRIEMTFAGDPLGLEGTYRLSASVSEGKMLGAGEDPANRFFNWTAERKSGPANDEATESKKDFPELPVRYPSTDYGLKQPPLRHDNVLVRNATIWTQGPEGIMENADMLISGGRISAVGQNINAPRGTIEIDAEGMHVTPGLIDPHIHTSIARGVNETGDAITSETRITDVINTNNVWIYRLLAGGITSATLFHGSANPIGGQSAVIKMKWGGMPEDLIVDDATPGLKFALGENVKRLSGRYPSTRQGTEQIIRDYFLAAEDYGRKLEEWESDGQGLPPRRDLRLEAILEVIRGERKAHVHAYRQDEMLMMLRLAEEFGFTIGSFEHTLEGYKIADELRDHGAAAVIWTDWSSFKVEAYDGILYNARLLNDVGVLTSLHSDNTQLSTRMNWEAAKTMMTGVDEEDAMNFITLHPAKIMGIDHRTGSLEEGKDADFVIWNGHPLSSFSTPRQTWIEGRKYFDREQDEVLYDEVKKERTFIINHIIESR